jgi:signal transduction histidine kinase
MERVGSAEAGVVRWRGKPADEPVVGLSREELAAIVAAGRVVNEASGESTALQRILDEAIGLLAADEGSIILLDRKDHVLRIRAARGIADDIVAQAEIPLGHGIAGTVAASGRPVVLSDEEGLNGFERDYERARPLRYSICVPLRTGAGVEGVLTANILASNSEHPGFGEHELLIASIFAEQAASALRARRLLEEADHQREILHELYEAGYALASSLELGDLGTKIVAFAKRFTGADGAFVALQPADDEPPTVIANDRVHFGRALASVRRRGFKEMLASGRQQVVEVHGDGPLAPLAQSPEIKFAVVAPVLTRRRCLGAIVTTHGATGPSEGQLEMLGAIVAHASLALSKAVTVGDLEKKDRELSRLTLAVPEPIIVVESDGRMSACNPAAAELLGLDDRFVAGTHVSGRLRSGELEDLVLSEHGGQAEVTLKGPNPRTYRARVSLLDPGLGSRSARILVLDDVTVEAEMRRIKRDFVSVIGHELRTPLTLIKGYAATLNKPNSLPDEARAKAIDSLYVHTLRLERLIEDLLLVARIERGRPPLSVAERDVVSVVRDAVTAASQEYPDRQLTFEAQTSRLTMSVDSVKVEQILHHLISNAIKFSDPDQPVEVSLAAIDETVEIAVRDHGIGIFSGDLPHLFERFHQVDGSETRRHGGTAVGLYICKTLTEAHGGQIDVQSVLGKGSTFTITLPRTGPGSMMASPAAVAQLPSA